MKVFIKNKILIQFQINFLFICLFFLSSCFNKASDSKLKNKVGLLEEEKLVQGPIGNSALSFTPDTWAFGALLTNSEVGTKTFSIKNIAEKPLTLKQTESTSSDFQILASTCTENKILQPNSTCELTIEFAPTVGGIFSSIISVYYEAENGVEAFYSALNLTGSGSTLLNFAGLDSIDNITGTKMTLNWTGVDEVDSYQIYRINGTNVTLISSQSKDSYCNLTDCEYEVTGLNPGTEYTFRVRATDTGGVQESNLVNVSESTWGAANFSTIANLSVAEGATAQTANLSCVNGNGSSNSFSFISQSDAVTDCSLTAASGASVKVECSPGYKTGHSNWSGTVTIACTIDDQTYQRTLTVNVTDSNRAPQIEFHPSSNQSIAAGSAMTGINTRDTNTTNDTDRDGDTITYSCTFEGGGNAAGTNCSTLPNTTYNFNTTTGVLSWTPSIAAAVGGIPTDYTITVSGTDGSLSDTTEIDITVNPAVIITDINDYLFPNDYIDIGETLSVNANNIAGGGGGVDTNMSYACTFDKVIDGAVAAGSNCTSLPGTTATFNTSSGVLTWVPNNIAYGAYEIKIVGTNTDTISDDEIFLVNIRAPYILSNLIGSWEAQYGLDGKQNGLNSAFTTYLKDLTTALTTNDGELINFAEATSSGWTGDGARTISGASDGPYRIVFDGVNDYLDFGTGMNNNNNFKLSAWVRPTEISGRGKVILSNVDSSNRGIKIKQSYDGTGRIQAQLGKSIDDEYMQDSPALYWQLNENSTKITGVDAIKDSSGNGYHGTPNLWSLGVTKMNYSNHTGIKSAGTNGSGGSWSKWTRFIEKSNFALLDSATSFDLEFYYYLNAPDNSNYGIVYWGDGVASSTNMFAMAMTNGASGARFAVYAGGLTNYVLTPISSIPAGWSHVVVKYDGSQATNTTKLKVYINGVNQALSSAGTIPTSLANLSGNAMLRLGSAIDSGGGAYFDNPQHIAHFAIYQTPLSVARISAHYSARLLTSCISGYPIVDDSWAHLSATYNSGTSAFNFYYNGRNICSRSTYYGASYYGNSSEPITVGSNVNQTNHWTGELAELKLYSSFANWDVFDHLFSSQYRFGRSKEKPITDRLVFFLDAANAKQEGGTYTAGACTNSSHKWYGSSNSFENFSASFVNFNTTDCSNGNDGWQGDGTTANPYHVKFDGTNDYMTLSDDIVLTGDFTLVAWIKRNGANWSHIFSASTGSPYPFFGINNANDLFFTNTGTNTSTSTYSFTSGNWHQIAMTRSMTNTGTGCTTAPCVTYYVNGVQLGNMIADPLAGANVTYDQIAARTVATSWFHNGGIAALGVYSDVLTSSEILQMCQTYASRFPSGQACNP